MIKTAKIQTVKPSAVAPIEVSGAFLNALNGVVSHIIGKFPEEEAFAIMTEIRDTDGDMNEMSDDAKDIYILMTLIKSIDTSFKEHGLVVTREVKYDDNDTKPISSEVDSLVVEFDKSDIDKYGLRADDSNTDAIKGDDTDATI